MKKTHALLMVLVSAFSTFVFAQPAGYAEIAASQAPANTTPGIRKSPAHTTQTPTNDVSPQMLIQKMQLNGKS
jgi:hypothetical protein